MKRLFFVFAIFVSSLGTAQEYTSKVSAINGQNVKYQSKITIKDDTITITSADYTLIYIIENQIQHYYQLDLYNTKFNLTVAEVKGRSLGFKYTHAITLADASGQQSPIIYYAILKD